MPEKCRVLGRRILMLCSGKRMPCCPKAQGSESSHLKALRHIDGVSGSGCMSLSIKKASQRSRQACFQASCSSVRSLNFLDCTGRMALRAAHRMACRLFLLCVQSVGGEHTCTASNASSSTPSKLHRRTTSAYPLAFDQV